MACNRFLFKNFRLIFYFEYFRISYCKVSVLSLRFIGTIPKRKKKGKRAKQRLASPLRKEDDA